MVSLGRTNRAWLLVVALGLAAAAPEHGPQQPQGKAVVAGDAQQQGGRPAPAPPLDKRPVEAISPANSGNRDQEQPSKTLARAAALAAIVQAVTSVLGLIGLFFTVVFAAKAWREAERSADAATKAIKQDAEQSVRELRAYVFVDGVSISGPILADTDLPDITIGFRNSGQTPAYDVRSSVRVAFLRPESNPPNFAEPDISNVLGPNGVLHKEVVGVETPSARDVLAINNGVMEIIVFGYVRYRTFRKECFTNFRYKYMPGQNPVLSLCPAGNEADEDE